MDIVVSSMFSKCGVNITYNSILWIPWCYWFSSPAFHFSRNGLDTVKIFYIRKEKFCFYYSRHIWSAGTSLNIEFLVSYPFTVNGR